MQQKIEKIIIEVLEDLNEELENKNLNNPTKATQIYGSSGFLDSLALVSFITDLEEKISDELDIDVVLADEKAMSQRTSPFRTVNSLTSYILEIIEE